MPKKNATKKTAGRIKAPKPITVEIPILDSVSVDDEDSLRETLEYIALAQESLKQVTKFIEIGRNHATTYMHSGNVPVIQLDGFYWRVIQRMSRFFVATPADMPDPKPKGAKSLKELCQGKTVKSGSKTIPLWSFITKRVIDPSKIDQAVNLGYLKQSEVDKTYLESPQKPFIQKFDGEALDADEE
jgi:hypothetical protein